MTLRPLGDPQRRLLALQALAGLAPGGVELELDGDEAGSPWRSPSRCAITTRLTVAVIVTLPAAPTLTLGRSPWSATSRSAWPGRGSTAAATVGDSGRCSSAAWARGSSASAAGGTRRRPRRRSRRSRPPRRSRPADELSRHTAASERRAGDLEALVVSPATKRASWDSETSSAIRTRAGSSRSRAGCPAATDRRRRSTSSRILPTSRRGPVLELQRDQLPVGGDVAAIEVSPPPGFVVSQRRSGLVRRRRVLQYDVRAGVRDHARAEERRMQHPGTAIGSSELLVTGRT